MLPCLEWSGVPLSHSLIKRHIWHPEPLIPRLIFTEPTSATELLEWVGRGGELLRGRERGGGEGEEEGHGTDEQRLCSRECCHRLRR